MKVSKTSTKRVAVRYLKARSFQKAWHVAPAKKDRLIEKDGLIPVRGEQYVYVWADQSMAFWFADHAPERGRQSIWEVDTKGLQFKPDPETKDMSDWSSNFYEGQEGHGYMHKGPISPDRLRKI